MKTTMKKMADITVSNHGSVFLFTFNNPETLADLRANSETASWQWLGSRTLAVDHHLAPALAEQLQENGWSLA